MRRSPPCQGMSPVLGTHSERDRSHISRISKHTPLTKFTSRPAAEKKVCIKPLSFTTSQTPRPTIASLLMFNAYSESTPMPGWSRAKVSAFSHWNSHPLNSRPMTLCFTVTSTTTSPISSDYMYMDIAANLNSPCKAMVKSIFLLATQGKTNNLLFCIYIYL